MGLPGRALRRAFDVMRSPTARAAAFYVVLTLALTYPLSLHPASTTFPPSSDLNLYIWTLAWNAHAFLHHPLSIFDANIFYPYHRTLAYSENLIGAALLVAPVHWLLQEPLLTMNLAALATVPLCALGAFVLARRLELSLPAAWICGLVYGFAPPRFLRLDQAHLTAVEWIPYCLAYAHTYVKTRRPYDLRVAIAFLSLQALTSGHGAVFLIFALACWAVCSVATGSRPALLQALRDTGMPGALLLLPSALLFIPYRMVQAEVGLRRELGDWTGAWASFLSSPTHVDSFILDHLGSFGAWVNTNTQASLFPGYLPLLLAAAAFMRHRSGDTNAPSFNIATRAMNIARWPSTRRGDARVFYGLLVVACALLAVGPPYGPWRFLYWLPGLSFIRVPSRFMILATLGVAVLCAFGFERLTRRASSRTRRLVAAAVCAALIGEFAVIPFDVVPNPVVIPAADRWLDLQQRPFVVAELPPMDPSVPMLHSMAHWEKTVHGYSGWKPQLTQQIEEQLSRFPDEGSLDALSKVGVTYLVVHASMYPPGEWPTMERRLEQVGSRLTLRYRDSQGRVYALSRRPGADN